MPRSLNQGAASGIGSGYTAINNLVNITATDTYAKGDLVGLDYITGQNLNFSSSNYIPALSAGQTAAPIRAMATPTAADHCSSSVVVFSDGSYVVGHNRSYGNAITFTVALYSKQGTQLNIRVMFSSTSGAASYFQTMSTLLSNGNAAFVMNGGPGATYTFIVTPTLLQVGSSLNISDGLAYAMQATNDGGYLVVGLNYFYKVDVAAAAATRVSAVLTNQIQSVNGSFGHYSSNVAVTSAAISSNLWSITPVNISSGGFGFFVCQNSGSYGLTFIRFNADGSIRGSTSGAVITTAAYSGPNYSIAFARSSTGNILWTAANSNQGTTRWGIIADDGSIVLADANLSGSSSGSPSVSTFANGNFMLSYLGSGSCIINVVTSTGSAVSGWPVTYGSMSDGGLTHMFPLSTGIWVVLGGSGSAIAKFVNNAGTLVTSVGFPSIGAVYTYPTVAGCLISDTVYGVQLSGAGSGAGLAQEAISFKMDNTGVFTNQQAPLIIANTYAGSSQVVPYVVPTPIGFTAFFCYSGPNSYGLGWKSFAFDLSVKASAANITGGTGLTYTTSGGLRVTQLGKFYAVCASDSMTNGTSDPSTPGLILKTNTTIALGVAASAATSGALMTVATSGMLPINYATVASTFDQSSNNPPGNKGFIAGSVGKLSGF